MVVGQDFVQMKIKHIEHIGYVVPAPCRLSEKFVLVIASFFSKARFSPATVEMWKRIAAEGLLALVKHIPQMCKCGKALRDSNWPHLQMWKALPAQRFSTLAH